MPQCAIWHARTSVTPSASVYMGITSSCSSRSRTVLSSCVSSMAHGICPEYSTVNDRGCQPRNRLNKQLNRASCEHFRSTATSTWERLVVHPGIKVEMTSTALRDIAAWTCTASPTGLGAPTCRRRVPWGYSDPIPRPSLCSFSYLCPEFDSDLGTINSSSIGVRWTSASPASSWGTQRATMGAVAPEPVRCN